MSILLSLWTVLVFVFFIGVILYAIFANKKDLDAAARIPFTEESDNHSDNTQEINHG